MRPDLRIDALDFTVERLGIGFQFFVRCGRGRAAGEMVGRFFDLDNRAARIRQLSQLFIQRRGQVHDQSVIGLIVLVPQHHGQAGGADRAELHRFAGHLLRGFPDSRKMQGTARHFVRDRRRVVGFLHLVQDMARLDIRIVEKVRRIAKAAHPVEALNRIKEPGASAHFQIKTGVPIGEDVKAGLLLLVHITGNRVDILLPIE